MLTYRVFRSTRTVAPADKMAAPHVEMFWDTHIPRHVVEIAGARTEVTIIAGSVAGATAAAPPPSSWAARADAEVAIWHVRLEPGSSWTMPAAQLDEPGACSTASRATP